MQDSQTGHILVSLLKMVSLQHKSTPTCENTLGAGVNPSFNNSKLSEDACPTAETSNPSPLAQEVKAAFPSVPAAGWAWTDRNPMRGSAPALLRVQSVGLVWERSAAEESWGM